MEFTYRDFKNQATNVILQDNMSVLQNSGILNPLLFQYSNIVLGLPDHEIELIKYPDRNHWVCIINDEIIEPDIFTFDILELINSSNPINQSDLFTILQQWFTSGTFQDAYVSAPNYIHLAGMKDQILKEANQAIEQDKSNRSQGLLVTPKECYEERLRLWILEQLDDLVSFARDNSIPEYYNYYNLYVTLRQLVEEQERICNSPEYQEKYYIPWQYQQLVNLNPNMFQ